MDWNQLTLQKQKLDSYRPLPRDLVKNLTEWYNVELTYTSNAIEGNTLTRQETALVVEKGITVGGKSLREHLEAINHSKALEFIHHLTDKKPQQISTDEILAIHKIILTQIDDDNAGKYRTVMVRISGSQVILPNALKVPELMKDFITWLKITEKDHPAKIAAEAHLKLVTIHPFVDGNGRTARLLMNLILMQGGYPPAIIRVEDRLAYIKSLEKAQMTGDTKDYEKLILDSINRSFDIYFQMLKPE